MKTLKVIIIMLGLFLILAGLIYLLSLFPTQILSIIVFGFIIIVIYGFAKFFVEDYWS